MTNVIEGASELEVTLANGRNFPGNVVGFDKNTDISVANGLFSVVIVKVETVTKQ